jgi:hypothetical protein
LFSHGAFTVRFSQKDLARFISPRFPRSDALLFSYSRAHPDEREISGPRLLDRAWTRFCNPQEDDDETMVKIFRRLHQILEHNGQGERGLAL